MLAWRIIWSYLTLFIGAPLSRLLGPPWFAYLFDDLLDLFKAFVELGRIDVSVVGIYSNFNTVCIGWRSC